MKTLNVTEGAITLIPEQQSGAWTIPAQIQVENMGDEVYANIDRDDLDNLIEALTELRDNR